MEIATIVKLLLLFCYHNICLKIKSPLTVVALNDIVGVLTHDEWMLQLVKGLKDELEALRKES